MDNLQKMKKAQLLEYIARLPKESLSRVSLISWAIRQATTHGGTVYVANGTLSLQVPTTKPGGRGYDIIDIPLTAEEMAATGNVEAIGQ